jgi:hypothetical protein
MAPVTVGSAAKRADGGGFLGHSDPALEVATFRHREVADGTVHLGVIEAVKPQAYGQE